MEKILSGNLGFNLEKKQIKLMFEKALFLIENLGIKVPHEGILNILSNYDGVKIDKDIVCFKPGSVIKAIKRMKFKYPEYIKPNDYFILGGAHQEKIYDIFTGNIRATTISDLIDLTKLCDFLGIYGSAPVRPLDMPIHLQEILMYKVSWENSKYKSSDLFEHNPKSNHLSANYIYEMAKAANKWFSINIWMISPRKFAWSDLEVIYRFRDKKVPMCITTMPIAGMTAPITMLGAYTQSMFELFAGLTLLDLINPDSFNYLPPMDNIRAYYFDMKYSNFIYGSPEDVRGTIYQIKLNNYFKIPVVAKSLLTSSKNPDGQACFEKGIHTMIAILLGVKGFTNAGLLSVDEIFSAEQLIIDKEILQYCSSTLKAEEFSEGNLLVDDIINTPVNGTFINNESTISDFKKNIWEPKLFIHDSFDQWVKNGKKTLFEKANKMAKDILAKHNHELAPEIKKEIDKIYRSATQDKSLEESFHTV